MKRGYIVERFFSLSQKISKKINRKMFLSIAIMPVAIMAVSSVIWLFAETAVWSAPTGTSGSDSTVVKLGPVAVSTEKPGQSQSSNGGSSSSKESDVDEPTSGGSGDRTRALAALSKLRQEINLFWLMVASFLVFLMQAGFAYLEAGFTRSKNVVNILMKNVADFSLGSMVFWGFGFAVMFGPFIFSGVGIGVPSFFNIERTMLAAGDGSPDPYSWGFLLFQMVFAGTAATIASGAMAERTRFAAYLVVSVVTTGIIYPVYGSLAWSSLFDSAQLGLLEKLGFIDFAGSTVVHSVGAWVGLAGAVVLGPRLGKYESDGTINPIFGHNMTVAALGGFLLWFGWFGFNPGSTGAIDGGEFAIVAVTTNMAAVAGALGAMATSWILFKQSDVTMVINGVLAGLVSITAGAYNVGLGSSVIIGLVAGILVVFSVIAIDHLGVDDPVGAVSVHGVAGAWGTLAVGLFAHPAFGSNQAGLFFGGGWGLLASQALGVAIAFVWAFGAAFFFFKVVDKLMGLRVAPEVEMEGLDTMEHGTQAYPDLVL